MKHDKNQMDEFREFEVEPDKRQLLEHRVYEALDKGFWRISEKSPGSSHPGFCWHVDLNRRQAVLYKGTSQQPKRSEYLHAYAIIDPSEANGLNSTTYFQVNEPFTRTLNQIELLSHNRCRGKLGLEDVQRIEEALSELKGGQYVSE